ncbi:MAG: zinc ribbon domain-containing protein [Deltaproteobacteria bacterium]
MATVNLKEQLEMLRQLQEVDTQIYRMREEKNAKPREIEVLKSAFEQKKQTLAVMEKTYLDAQKEKKDRELEFQSKEEAGKKLQSQLYALKTNKEYNTMLQQIKDAKADASVIEDRILESMDKIDKAKAAVEDEKKRLQGEEQAFNAEKRKVEDRVKEIDSKLAQLEADRNRLIPGIDKKILADYDRILKSREGLAIVCVRKDMCGGCNMKVPPQVINMIRMYERIQTCEVCNRILAGCDD